MCISDSVLCQVPSETKEILEIVILATIIINQTAVLVVLIRKIRLLHTNQSKEEAG
jgi:hypothetical protein